MNRNTGWEQCEGEKSTRWFIYRGYWTYAIHKIRRRHGGYVYELKLGRARIFHKTLAQAKDRVLAILKAAGKE